MIFLNSASSGAALVFYLPGVCTHTDIEGKQSPENISNTIFNEHPVCEQGRMDGLKERHNFSLNILMIYSYSVEMCVYSKFRFQATALYKYF